MLDTVDDPALLRQVRERGAELREGLLALDGIAEVRGRGLMIGVGLDEGIDAAAVGRTCCGAAWSSTCRPRTRCGCCRRWWSSPPILDGRLR